MKLVDWYLKKVRKHTRNANTIFSRRSGLTTEDEQEMTRYTEAGNYIELWTEYAHGDGGEQLRQKLLDPPVSVRREADALYREIDTCFTGEQYFPKKRLGKNPLLCAAFTYLHFTDRLSEAYETHHKFFRRRVLVPTNRMD